MNDAVITMTGNFAALLSEYDKLNAKVGKLESQNMRLKKSSKEAADASSKLTAGAKQALDAATPATEKYRQTLASLRAQLESGKITEEKYNAARKAAQATFMATSESVRRRSELEREAKAVVEANTTAQERHANELANLNKLRAAGAISETHYARAVAAADLRLKEATKDTNALAEAQKQESKVSAFAAQATDRHTTAKARYTENVRLAKRALDSGKISLETYNAELAYQKRLLDEAEATGTRFAGTLKAVGAAAAIAVAGIQALAAEEEKRNRLRQAAADENVAYGEVLARTMNNFTADATVGGNQLDSELGGIQVRQGIRDRKMIARVAGDAFSAKGTLTNKQALEFVEQGFRYAGEDEATATAFAGRSLDIAKATGQSDPKAVMGFLSSTQKAARVSQITALGNEGVQAMLGAQVYGATPEQSAELFATLNSLMTDVQGANSKTAMLALTGQLMDSNRIEKAGLTKDFAGLGLMERIATMQANPELAKQFMGAEGISFEVAAKPFIGKFLSGDATAMAEYQNVQAMVPALDASAAALFDKLLTERSADPRVKLSMQDRQRTANLQAKKIDDELQAARDGVANQAFNDVLENTDLPGFDGGMDIPVITPITSALGAPLRVPGTGTLMRTQAWMKKTFQGKSAADANRETLQGLVDGERGAYGASDSAYVTKQMLLMQEQQVDLQKQQLEEQRKANAKPAPPPPPPPPMVVPSQPLIGARGPEMRGRGDGGGWFF